MAITVLATGWGLALQIIVEVCQEQTQSLQMYPPMAVHLMTYAAQ